METAHFQGSVTLVVYDLFFFNFKYKLLGLPELSKRGCVDACLVGQENKEGQGPTDPHCLRNLLNVEEAASHVCDILGPW